LSFCFYINSFFFCYYLSFHILSYKTKIEQQLKKKSSCQIQNLIRYPPYFKFSGNFVLPLGNVHCFFQSLIAIFSSFFYPKLIIFTPSLQIYTIAQHPQIF
jgi:hypothetical protein